MRGPLVCERGGLQGTLNPAPYSTELGSPGAARRILINAAFFGRFAAGRSRDLRARRALGSEPVIPFARAGRCSTRSSRDRRSLVEDDSWARVNAGALLLGLLQRVACPRGRTSLECAR